MLIKFLGGRGGGGPIAAYLTDAHRAGREAAAPEVLRGDVERTRELIDGIDRRWTYTTGVISFAREDAPTEDQQRAVMDDFERVAFAGLDAEQYDIAWVRHRHTEGGRVELHFLVPRMELTTGKALNIAPPGWERTYAPLRDAWNHAEGWARPDDPERARTLQGDRQSPERARTRETIAAFLEERVAAGEIEDRAGIVAALEEAGFTVPRQGKDYVTAADPETGARFRLKGRLYERDWTRGAELDRAARREAQGPAGPSLTARLEEKLRQDRERIEALTLSELQKLAESLSRSSRDALDAMESSTRERMARMRSEMDAIARRQRLWPLWTALSCATVAAALFALLWVATGWERSELGSLLRETARAERTLRALEARTGGVVIQRAQAGTFVIVPEGTEPGWTCGESVCLKLPE